MLLQILVLLLILFIDISQAKSARLRTSSLKTNRMFAVGFLSASLPFVPIMPSFAANDAFIAAQKAMTEKSNREFGVERDLKDLPPASKKRKAIAGCKDPAMRKAAGYLTASKCTSDAVDGQYDQMIKALSGEISAPTKKGRR